MMQKEKKFIEGEYYHIYARGNNRQKIFQTEKDYERFVKLLYIANGEKKFNFRDDIIDSKISAYIFPKGKEIVNICAYALMPNHYHLYIYVPRFTMSENVSDFIKKVNIAYCKYFNSKYKRTGTLFEGRFKYEHIKNDEHFKYLFAYIHLNPVKLIQSDWKEAGILDFEKAREFLHGYKHSSFIDYFIDENRVEGRVLNKQAFLGKFENHINLQDSILDWMKYSKS